jgi:hypothetical protein
MSTHSAAHPAAAADPAVKATATHHPKPTALICEPSTVYHLNWLLGLYDGGVIDQDTLGRFIADEIQAGSIMTLCWDSVEAHLTGRTLGYCEEVRMEGVDGKWWTTQRSINEELRDQRRRNEEIPA